MWDTCVIVSACAGCKRCKHAGTNKGVMQHHSARNSCPACEPSRDESAELKRRSSNSGAQLRGKDAGATCQPRPHAHCECPFHAREEERRLDKVGPCQA